MSRSAYSRFTCWICHGQYSANGLSRTNHLRKHVREGLLTESVIHWVDAKSRRQESIMFETVKRPPPTIGGTNDHNLQSC